LATISYELHGRYATRMSGPVPAWAASLTAPFTATMLASEAQVSLSAFAGPAPGTWSLNEAARIDDAISASFGEPVAATNLGSSFAKALIQVWASAPSLAQWL